MSLLKSDPAFVQANFQNNPEAFWQLQQKEVWTCERHHVPTWALALAVRAHLHAFSAIKHQFTCKTQEYQQPVYQPFLLEKTNQYKSVPTSCAG